MNGQYWIVLQLQDLLLKVHCQQKYVGASCNKKDFLFVYQATTKKKQKKAAIAKFFTSLKRPSDQIGSER
jgi:hypothetical protein